ncbi:MAG: hypothetical protein GX946_04670 [Oligosphaeraceae bacterium]|nr:hypothetical protein [Oligosphaeraceae bacterium]
MKKLTMLLCLALTLSTFTACSAFRREGRTRAHTLMITGNYMNSRLLCDLAQYRTKQPILLFSMDAARNQQIFYLPTPPKVEPIRNEEFVDMVSFINPKRIVVVGGSDYVPQEYIDRISAKFPVMIYNSEDWEHNARMLGDLLNQRSLRKEFVDSKARLVESGVSKQ